MSGLMPIPGTRIGKIAFFLLAASVVSLIGISALSGLQGELRGGIAFGLIVATVLLIPVLVLACWIPEMLFATKITWLSYCVIALTLLLIAAGFGGTKDLDIVAATLVAVLAFPIGIVVVLGGNLLFGVVSPVIASIVLWAAAVALGYWQWFAVLPAIIHRR